MQPSAFCDDCRLPWLMQEQYDGVLFGFLMREGNFLVGFSRLRFQLPNQRSHRPLLIRERGVRRVFFRDHPATRKSKQRPLS
jgi:hypothetical protein